MHLSLKSIVILIVIGVATPAATQGQSPPPGPPFDNPPQCWSLQSGGGDLACPAGTRPGCWGWYSGRGNAPGYPGGTGWKQVQCGNVLTTGGEDTQYCTKHPQACVKTTVLCPPTGGSPGDPASTRVAPPKTKCTPVKRHKPDH